MAAPILSAAVALTATLASSSHVSLASTDVRVADVATVRGEGADRARTILIARLGRGQARTLQRAEVIDLLRRAIPALTVVGGGAESITLAAPAVGPEAVQDCFEASVALAPGEPVTSKDVRPAECSSGRTAAAVLRDANRGIALAAGAIRPGDYLGRLLVGEAPAIARGDRLTLVSRAGPVTISRQVTALQQAGPKQHRLFVRTADGSVFSAPLADRGAR